MKTNKALRSRIKVTRNGKLLVRGKGHAHGNAKEPRNKQLARKRTYPLSIPIRTKTRRHIIAQLKK